MGKARGVLTAAAYRRKALEILDGADCAVAWAREGAALQGVGLTTLQSWRRIFVGGGDSTDHRKGSQRHVADRLIDDDRQRILLTCNVAEFAVLPPGQIVPVLAERVLFIGSERSFYRVLHPHGQAHRRGRARLPMEPRPCRGYGLMAPTKLELGYFLSANKRQMDLALPLPNDGCVV